MRLVNTQYPYLNVVVDSGPPAVYRQFDGGILEVPDDDPYHDKLKSWAAGDNNTSIHASQPRSDGEAYEAMIKGAAGRGLVCEVCSPPQPFEDENALAEHTLFLHANRPALGPDGEDTRATDVKPPTTRVRVAQGTAKTTTS